MANTGRSLYSTIRRRQMKFTGHIYRARRIEHLAMTRKINGKNSRGRQRTTYVDSLYTWANLEQRTRSQFMRSSCERQIWKNHDRQCLLQTRHLMMMMMMIILKFPLQWNPLKVNTFKGNTNLLRVNSF
ncbi:hypothetical protein ElyMa_005025600 [Elysia marginata]|uniref:Uncharacterized protein n=1 Tax=Elysia marginata TaxID=1093978 RepID=A0AAV4J8S5_9GAST|nr:hypothetical protein ElyMa_005025600 [Elysia marginata]